MESFELHLPVTQEVTALELLSSQCSLSKGQLKSVMQKGAVWLSVGKKTQRLRRAKKVLSCGQTLHLYYNESALSDDFVKPQLLEDCGDYSVWYKPCGMMSQGSKWGDHTTISRYAQLHLSPARSAFIVHRLDRATQGIILIAHTKTAVRELTQLFEQRKITKKYQAVVRGHFEHITEFEQPIDERHAYTKVTLINYDETSDVSLVDVDIATGRKHQIRRHLSEGGWPIIGDRLYGGHDEGSEADLQLCAYFLAFDCPMTGQPKQLTVSPKLILRTDQA